MDMDFLTPSRGDFFGVRVHEHEPTGRTHVRYMARSAGDISDTRGNMAQGMGLVMV